MKEKARGSTDILSLIHISRGNLLLTFVEYYQNRWKCQPPEKQLRTVANVIAWNLWQMDGLKDTVPFGKHYEEHHQMTIFEDVYKRQRYMSLF